MWMRILNVVSDQTSMVMLLLDRLHFFSADFPLPEKYGNHLRRSYPRYAAHFNNTASATPSSTNGIGSGKIPKVSKYRVDSITPSHASLRFISYPDTDGLRSAFPEKWKIDCRSLPKMMVCWLTQNNEAFKLVA